MWIFWFFPGVKVACIFPFTPSRTVTDWTSVFWILPGGGAAGEQPANNTAIRAMSSFFKCHSSSDVCVLFYGEQPARGFDTLPTKETLSFGRAYFKTLVRNSAAAPGGRRYSPPLPIFQCPEVFGIDTRLWIRKNCLFMNCVPIFRLR